MLQPLEQTVVSFETKPNRNIVFQAIPFEGSGQNASRESALAKKTQGLSQKKRTFRIIITSANRVHIY